MKTQLKADLMLVIVTLGWGMSYYFIDICLKEMGTFTLNAFRFLGAFLAAGVLAFPRLKHVNMVTLKYSLYIGIALVIVYIGATFGVKYTSLSNAGFLCALAVVFTPVLAFFVKKQKPGRKLMVVIVLCIIGIALMTLDGHFKMAFGDILCLMCAFAYSIDLLITEAAVSRADVNAFQLGVFQLGFTGIFMLVFSFIFEEPSLPYSLPVWSAAIFLAVFCTGVAFIVQAVAQQYTTAAHVGVIFTLEPVFAGIVAFLLAGEILLPRAYAGASMMLLGLLIMETNPKGILNMVKEKFLP
ncbi:Predicted permease%2C DMT superfamily [uncultured Eubacterium sp.]|uniref:DMT family transporter n=1 Tax=Brotomerdimonas butyrica TaxID=2981721 RepID=UPI0008215577|nr:DMT family transporter [Brotomerdimonas butyrica]MCU6755322.1 DMT family transporter [Brotomerdimonas butyrica]SCH22804.1 Predicted permease%2C DMT superfamily [uncultured Eubacterium sp.]